MFGILRTQTDTNSDTLFHFCQGQAQEKIRATCREIFGIVSFRDSRFPRRFHLTRYPSHTYRQSDELACMLSFFQAEKFAAASRKGGFKMSKDQQRNAGGGKISFSCPRQNYSIDIELCKSRQSRKFSRCLRCKRRHGSVSLEKINNLSGGQNDEG